MQITTPTQDTFEKLYHQLWVDYFWPAIFDSSKKIIAISFRTYNLREYFAVYLPLDLWRVVKKNNTLYGAKIKLHDRDTWLKDDVVVHMASQK